MLINQGIIINVILIFSILWLANYLSEGSIFLSVKNLLKLDNLNLLNKKYNIKNLKDNEASSMEKFFKSLIIKNKTTKVNFNKIYKPNDNDKKRILKFLENKISNEEHKIKDISINNLLFYKKENGFEFKPFLLEGKYYYNNKYKGIIKLQLEISFKFDNANSIFISPQKITNHSGNYLLHRITFIDLNNKNEKILKRITSDSENIKKDKKIKKINKIKKNKKIKSSSEQNESSESSESSTESSSESDKSFENNSVNSLIPDEIEFSTELNTSLNQSA